jgi:hypothetical protein
MGYTLVPRQRLYHTPTIQPTHLLDLILLAHCLHALTCV